MQEIDETENLYDYGGGSRDSKIEVDKYLFIVLLFQLTMTLVLPLTMTFLLQLVCHDLQF